MNNEEMQQKREHQENIHRQQAEDVQKIQRAQRQHAEVQAELNTLPKRKYAAIVAVDLHGAFSKAGQIPWHYRDDFKWFQEKTRDNVCVMGRTTYDDICFRLGEKAHESALPNRKCIVVTSRPLARTNATSIASLSTLDFQLDKLNIPYDQTIFYIGGERVYLEGMSKVDTVYMTVVNKEVDGDKFFPRNLLQKQFDVVQTELVESEPDIRFVTWKRRPTP
jgi:dihydrofolate reductase